MREYIEEKKEIHLCYFGYPYGGMCERQRCKTHCCCGITMSPCIMRNLAIGRLREKNEKGVEP
jgi:hypothetical protein